MQHNRIILWAYILLRGGIQLILIASEDSYNTESHKDPVASFASTNF